MTRKSFPILALTLVMALLLAIFGLYYNWSSVRIAPSEELLLPSLESQLNNLTLIRLASKNANVSLEKKEGKWYVKDISGIPADIGEIRSLVQLLATSKKREKKTSDPLQYTKLGLHPDTATHLTLYSAPTEKPISDLYIGKILPHADSTYVRLADSPTSWLVSGNITPIMQASGWLDTRFLSIQPERIKHITISPLKGNSIILNRTSQDTPEFTLSPLKKNEELRSPLAIAQLVESIGYIEVQKTAKRSSIPFQQSRTITLRIETFDGVVTTLKLTDVAGKKWLAYHAEILSPSAPTKKKSKPSRTRLPYLPPAHLINNTVYQVGDALFASLSQTLDQLLQKRPSQ